MLSPTFRGTRPDLDMAAAADDVNFSAPLAQLPTDRADANRPTMDDNSAARRAQTGDRAAFTLLVERHYDALVGYLYRLTDGDRAAAHDLAQEAFVRAWRNLAQYQPARPFKAWLYGIALHCARESRNRADARRVQDWDEAYDPAAPPDDDDDAQAVRAALAELPPHQREAVMLVYYGGFSLQEAADTLSIPLGTVKSRLSLAVGRLRAALRLEDQS
jgi:RNA polymerase sigma-70 factor (ECF subfamily)